MKTVLAKAALASVLLASLLAMPIGGGPALAQDNPGNPPSGASGITPETLSPGGDAPSPVTGELVPLPVAPPEGGAANIKLPDCQPPNCGVPQIMTE